jgi:membrane-associated phospholipid phosphatase
MRQLRSATIALVTAAVALCPAPAVAEEDSIYKVDPVIDGAIIGASAALVISLYVFGSGVIDVRCPCDPREVNALDRHAIGNDSGAAAWLSDVTVGLALLGPAALDWFALRDVRPYLEDLTVYAEAIAVSAAMVTTLKHATGRPFPRTYAGDPELVGSVNGYRSFYSGHTALAFTALSTASVTIGERYGLYLWPWLTTVVVGTSVAIERVAAGWHFPTDVMVGAVAGTAVGVAVPLLHLRRLRLVPFDLGAPRAPGVGLALAGRWP